MYLIDTNIILELLLDQKKAKDVEKFLKTVPRNNIFLSQFTLHSLGVKLFTLRMHKSYIKLLSDFFWVTTETKQTPAPLQPAVYIVKLNINELKLMTDIAQQYNLDFDDAYRYVAAEKNDLTIVSFDSDFDRTDRGRKTPSEVLRI